MDRKLFVFVVALSALGLTACDGGKAETKDEVAAKEDGDKAAAPAEGEAKDEGEKVAANAESDEEEGCVYPKDEKGKHEHHAVEPSDEPGHYGSKFALAETKTLAEVLGAETVTSDAVQVSGTVEKVCQKAGCWMELKDGEKTARILMKDHAFVVPMDKEGEKATVEGTIATRTFNEKQVKHLEKDAGGDPDKVSGERTEYVLTATGVRFES